MSRVGDVAGDGGDAGRGAGARRRRRPSRSASRPSTTSAPAAGGEGGGERAAEAAGGAGDECGAGVHGATVGPQVRLEVKGSAMELLAIGEVSARAGMAPSALRYYEEQGLISSDADARRRPALSPQRAAPAGLHPRRRGTSGCRCRRSASALETLPPGRPPTARRLGAAVARGGGTGSTSRSPRSPSCGTGSPRASAAAACPSDRCALSNPGDVAARRGRRRPVAAAGAAPDASRGAERASARRGRPRGR